MSAQRDTRTGTDVRVAIVSSGFAGVDTAV
jgi:hypothetical protein